MYGLVPVLPHLLRLIPERRRDMLPTGSEIDQVEGAPPVGLTWMPEWQKISQHRFEGRKEADDVGGFKIENRPPHFFQCQVLEGKFSKGGELCKRLHPLCKYSAHILATSSSPFTPARRLIRT